MAIELSAAREERRSVLRAVARIISGAARRMARRERRAFHDHEEQRRFERELEARTRFFREGGPW
jgi:hypothetical protein